MRTSCGIFAIAMMWLATLLVGCDQRDSGSVATPSAPVASTAEPPLGPNEIEVLFVYGSEKQKWIADVTQVFNAQKQKLPDSGKTIRVKTVPMGSGESKDDILAGRIKPHLWSPASAVFVKLANAESQTKGSPLVGQTREVVLSPVVIAMWEPMARALGWPDKPVGWSDVLALAKDPSGWASRGRPEFGKFKFGHTHPEYSNSGLIAILAEAFAGAGKVRDLSSADLKDPKVAQYVADIEKSIVHYGRSTGFFGRRLIDDGPTYLSAAILYENMVVESYAKPMPAKLVAIYPKEGTIWSDHPVGVVQRDWVDDEHRAAAELYVKFLLDAPQQQKALTYGFRPAKGDVAAPIDAAHGVDPQQPTTILELPAADVIGETIELWRRNKKHSSVALVFDKSGSMNEEGKIGAAKQGATDLINLLNAEDSLVIVPFSDAATVIDAGPMSSGRVDAISRVNGLIADGSTHLYEAISAARQQLAARAEPNRIRAIVVLTDGEDNGKTVTLDQLLGAVHVDPEGRQDVRVFTIGYGKSARLDDLKKIARESKGEFYEGKPENIRSVFIDIATFF